MCSGTLTDPRTLPCLHSFCLACLEAQVEAAPAPAAPVPAPASGSFSFGYPAPFGGFGAAPAPAPGPAPAPVFASFTFGAAPAPASAAAPALAPVPAPAALALCCHQCKAPFTAPSPGGVKSFECITFIDSLAKAQKDTGGDVNRVVKCDLCEDEDATTHCVDDSENLCQSCSKLHKRGKATAAHQQIPIEDALAGNAIMKRIPRCQKHLGIEVDTYCKTCSDAVCSKCLSQKHSGHTFCPLSQVTDPLRDQIAGYTVTTCKREEVAKKVISTLDGTINKIEEHRRTAEKEIISTFSALHNELELRQAVVIGEMNDKGDLLKKSALKEKVEVESATVQFREFHSFTEGLLAQGTPLEIAGTHKMVRA